MADPGVPVTAHLRVCGLRARLCGADAEAGEGAGGAAAEITVATSRAAVAVAEAAVGRFPSPDSPRSGPPPPANSCGVAAFWKGRTRALRSQAPLSPAPLPDFAVWVATCGPLCLSKLSPRRNVSGTLLTQVQANSLPGLKGVLQFSWPEDSLSPSPSLQWTPQVHRPHLAQSRYGPDHLPQLQESPDGVKQSCMVKEINCHCLLMKVLYQIFYSLSL
ncbi:uncharacterized protein LOC112406277 [Neophocaena asiaeorientalis asiaeorientalis]|uniref:Uncharacterized protein LOC112406277 n=1 Tax=Neophocaena asiaeorientalis asiaeorientalis TaxID=1706337 RepID=A0A341CA22_NEOAA|nr:uncharacterized protein LOC112406277 [Neophocaena asiaeorientalis asiaeorientalis]